jgi:hypothetical protein
VDCGAPVCRVTPSAGRNRKPAVTSTGARKRPESESTHGPQIRVRPVGGQGQTRDLDQQRKPSILPPRHSGLGERHAHQGV